MRFSGVLIISLLLHHRVIFAEGSFLRDEIFTEEGSVLEKFFAENKHQIGDENLRHITVIGTSDDQLQQTKPLLEAFPYFIGSDLKGICASKEFAQNTPVFYFLDSLGEEYVTKVLEGLRHCKKHRMYFIFDEIVANDDDIEMLFRVAFKKFGKQCVLIHPGKKSVKFYGYEMTGDCVRKSKLLSEWIPGDNWEGLSGYVRHFTKEGCPVSVGVAHRPPWMNIAKDKDGRVNIIGGSGGKIISTIADEMKFTPLVQQFDLSVENISKKTRAVVSSCAAGNTSIGIDHVRLTENDLKTVDVSLPFDHQCVVWCVPRITHWKMNIVASEFSWSTWILIALTFLASLAVERIVRNTSYWNRGNGTNSGWWSLILDFIGLTIGNPIVYKPLAMGGKMLLIVYLCYSTVITTAYKTSLSSMLTTEIGESSIVDVEGIIKANLTTGGNAFMLAILEDQKEENEFIPELIKRFVIETNMSKALRRVSHEENFAFMALLPELTYHKQLLEKAGDPVSFDVLDECVITQGSSLVFPKSSHLTDPINEILRGLASGGLLDHWLKNEGLPRPETPSSEQSSNPEELQESLLTFTRQKFFCIFYTYCVALIFCTFVFFGELVVHKFKLVEKFERFKNSKRPKVRRRLPFPSTSRRSN